MRPNYADTRRRVVDTRADAARRFEVFHDKQSKRSVKLNATWPKTMQHIGEGKAEIYTSSKWHDDPRDKESYKHVDEGNRQVYAAPGCLEPDEPLEIVGPMVALDGPMPQHITRLGEFRGIQMQLFAKKGKGFYLPNASVGRVSRDEYNQGFCEIRIPRALLGAAEHPDTGQTFLVVYTKEGIHMLLTGDKLAIERDGIVG